MCKGINYRVKGIIVDDEDEYEKMLAIYEACENANVSLPAVVDNYFDYEKPNGLGRTKEYDLLEGKDDNGIKYLELDMEDVDEDVRYIRFEIHD